MTRSEMIPNFDDPAFPETAAEFAALGRANAAEALDQVAAYDGLEDAVHSYGENLLQTLFEMGVEDGHPVIYAATDGFLAVLRENGINCQKPAGF